MVTELPQSDLRDKSFGKTANSHFSSIGFSAITGYQDLRSEQGKSIHELKEKIYTEMKEFMARPLDEKIQYHDKNSGGQRGYTPNGLEQSSGDSVREWREHVMVGPELPANHPIRAYTHTPLDNPTILGAGSKMIPLAVELLDTLNDLSLEVLENLAVAREEWFGTYASKMVWGDSVLRLHYYPKVSENKIIASRTLNGVETLEGKTVDGIDVIDIQNNGKLYRNVARTGPHTDIDFFAALLGSEQAGLCIDHNGKAVAFTSDPDRIVYNSGKMAHADLNIPEKIHWVNLNPEMAQRDRYSIVQFIHARPRASVGKSEEGIMLWTRLQEIGYFTQEQLKKKLEVIASMPTDKQMVKDILHWEAINHVDKLSKYFSLTREGFEKVETKRE
jgi:isopenicillin N synthase-like dioxygenase